MAGVLELGAELAAAIDPRIREGRLWMERTGYGKSSRSACRKRRALPAVALE